jgi:SAM-dependent methyltransferase
MSDVIFKQAYADHYDLLYKEKDYESECDLIEQAFLRYSKEPVKTILDMGCGTGNHLFPLAKRGYQLHGVDLSEHMLANAIKKSQSETFNHSPVFSHGDMRKVELGEKFDAILMMFAVLGYQLTNQDVLSTLDTVRKHLKPGGLFIFDVWYGPAVLAERPSQRIKVIPILDGKIIRAASGSLDNIHQICDVKYHLWHILGDKMVSETEEVHRVRFFFAQELALFLSSCGFMLQNLSAFPTLDRPADESEWNIFVVAQ